MKFVDSSKVYVQAGNGGHGCLSFRRERFRPKGGPDGGDAGRGGNVVLVGDVQMESLASFSHHPRLTAENGQHGRHNNQSGKDGPDLIVRVPVGTLIVDAETGAVLHDLNEGEKEFVAAKGGRGGRGNAQFATATNRVPRRAERGERGESRWLRLELKLLADVGLVGLPNAGKSALISKMSSASPRIAEYPFTTTRPHRGVVRDDVFRNFIVVDTPGLIANAHQGRGLGTRFLRHIERAKLLVHVLDATRHPGHNPVEDYDLVMGELRAFRPSLAAKLQLVAINKVDALETPRSLTSFEKTFAEKGIPSFSVSALTGEGLRPLIAEMTRLLEESNAMTNEDVSCEKGEHSKECS
jgi:GTP-binding protein